METGESRQGGKNVSSIAKHNWAQGRLQEADDAQEDGPQHRGARATCSFCCNVLAQPSTLFDDVVW